MGTTLLRPVTSIAGNTFREAVRNKVMGSLIFVAVFVAALSLVFGQMSLHEEERVVRDMGLSTATLFSIIIAIYTSVTLLEAEIERRTIYTLLSKPIHRWQFIVGKFLGIAALLLLTTLVFAATSSVLTWLQAAAIYPTTLWAFSTLYLQLIIVAALAILFSTHAGPLLSGISAGLIFVAGNLVSQLEGMKLLLEEQENPLSHLIDVLEVILPNLEALNLSNQATHGIDIPGDYLLSSVWYAFSYVAVSLLLAAIFFERRDFQ